MNEWTEQFYFQRVTNWACRPVWVPCGFLYKVILITLLTGFFTLCIEAVNIIRNRESGAWPANKVCLSVCLCHSYSKHTYTSIFHVHKFSSSLFCFVSKHPHLPTHFCIFIPWTYGCYCYSLYPVGYLFVIVKLQFSRQAFLSLSLLIRLWSTSSLLSYPCLSDHPATQLYFVFLFKQNRGGVVYRFGAHLQLRQWLFEI